MSDILPLTRPMRRNNIAQDAPGTIFSRGGATPVSPHFDDAQPRRRFSRVNVIRKFRAMEDGVDPAVPVDAQNASTSDLENCTNAVFHSAHTDHPFLQEEKEQRRTLQVCPSDCLNRGVHPKGQ